MEKRDVQMFLISAINILKHYEGPKDDLQSLKVL